MRHVVIWALAFGIVFAVVGTQQVDAAGSGVLSSFGGTIKNNKSTKIQDIESSNYRCIVPGSTFSFKPAQGSATGITNIFIPAGTKNKSGYYARAGQQVLGLFSRTTTTITCIFQGEPPTEQTTTLNPGTQYGTSQQ